MQTNFVLCNRFDKKQWFFVLMASVKFNRRHRLKKKSTKNINFQVLFLNLYGKSFLTTCFMVLLDLWSKFPLNFLCDNRELLLLLCCYTFHHVTQPLLKVKVYNCVYLVLYSNSINFFQLIFMVFIWKINYAG